MGIFSRAMDVAYAKTQPPIPAAPLSIASPWSPQDSLVTWAVSDAVEAFATSDSLPLTRELALRIPAIKRAHGIIIRTFASVPLRQMDGDQVTDEQPAWITASSFGVSPYHRLYGLGSDLFFHGWGLLAFNEDRTDAVHVPFGMWEISDAGAVVIDDGNTDRIPAEFHAVPVAIPLGYGENGLLIDGADTIRQARAVEAAYTDRLDNPVPLTVLTVDGDRWDGWTPEERTDFRRKWVDGRRAQGGSTVVKPTYVAVDMPGQVPVDLFETGRNGVRIDIANHVGLPVSMIEGVRQGGGGGGTDMRYTGVANGLQRNEVWDYGSPKGMLAAVEARLSMDDVVAPGLSIRGDLSNMLDLPAPTTNPTSED